MLVRRCIDLLRARDKGTAAVTFLLALPFLMLIVGILVQYALLANARLTLARALAAASRSAMTSLPTDPDVDGTDGPANVRRAACIVLASISPVSPESTADAQTVADALAAASQSPQSLPSSFAGRYSYADAAATVQIDPIDQNGVPLPSAFVYRQQPAGRVRITIRYDFDLTVPLVNMPLGALFGRRDTVAGITGRFFTLSASQDVQLSPGREAIAGATGEP